MTEAMTETVTEAATEVKSRHHHFSSGQIVQDGKVSRIFVGILLILAMGCSPSGPHQSLQKNLNGGSGPKPSQIGFDPDILAIVRARCTPCHTSPGGFDWTNYGNLSVRAKSGLLKVRITASGSSKMPPPGSPDLSQHELSQFLTWIEAGAPERPSSQPGTPDPSPGDPDPRPVEPTPPNPPNPSDPPVPEPPPGNPIGKCMGCHGEIETTNPRIPVLAGQRSDYLRRQLKFFAEGKRTDLVMGVMGGIAASLDSKEIEVITAHYQGLERKQKTEGFTGDRNRARSISSSCKGCHLTATGDSVDQKFPNLRWQNKDYLSDQMQNFKKGARPDLLSGGMMKSLMQQMAESDIDLLSKYFSLFYSDDSQPEPPPGGDPGPSPIPDPNPPPAPPEEPPIGQPTVTYWQDIRPIIQNKCAFCHGNPPLNWLDYEALKQRALSGELRRRVLDRAASPMPPPTVQQLTGQERALIRKWIEQRAPEGEAP